MSHYETLGVEPNASSEEVKRAYRKKASKAHPDRNNGEAGDMVEINKAYQVLIDPRRRKTYDKTGDDGGRPIDEQAKEALASAFAAALSLDDNVVVTVRSMLSMEKNERLDERKKAKQQRAKFVRRRDKIKAKTKVNIVHVLIDQAVEDLDAIIANADEALQVNAAVGKLLDAYESEEPVEIVLPHGVLSSISPRSQHE